MIRMRKRGDGAEAENHPQPCRGKDCVRHARRAGVAVAAYAVVLAAAFTFFSLADAPARADENVAAAENEAALPTPPDPALSGLRQDSGTASTLRYPRILSEHDAELYREVFALQKKGLWRAADRRIRKIKDRVLMGHVLAQRYLHPTGYRSKFTELRDWLKEYADLPEARRIYKLAMRRKPARARAPRRPRDRFAEAVDNDYDSSERDITPTRHVSYYERRVRRHIRRNVTREYLTVSERYLDQHSVARRLGHAGVDRMRAIVAGGWFRHGDTKRAYALADAAARRSGRDAPRASWWAGLAAFRMGHYDDARRHFEAMADARLISPDTVAQGAFWAARAALRAGEMTRVGPLMARAAKFERTFYGRIAARIRAKGKVYHWQTPEMISRDLLAFTAMRAGRRVMALIQVGQEVRAEAELKTLRVGLSPSLLRTVAALADAADMPGTALRAGRVLRRATGERLDSALYPLPHWVPQGGYLIDRALLYALARQESGFNVKAVSHAGARGLLQLMPATARYMAGQSFRGRHRHKLYEPRLNLALGQKYVDYLLNGDVASGNLVLALAAYNGGPGNVARWQRDIKHDSDPLVFIETIPVRETRNFVKSVLQNLWAYRARLSQDDPSLDALASGRWPVYVGLDGAGLGVAEERP